MALKKQEDALAKEAAKLDQLQAVVYVHRRLL
jgi:hypothetical protein